MITFEILLKLRWIRRSVFFEMDFDLLGQAIGSLIPDVNPMHSFYLAIDRSYGVRKDDGESREVGLLIDRLCVHFINESSDDKNYQSCQQCCWKSIAFSCERIRFHLRLPT